MHVGSQVYSLGLAMFLSVLALGAVAVCACSSGQVYLLHYSSSPLSNERSRADLAVKQMSYLPNYVCAWQ